MEAVLDDGLDGAVKEHVVRQPHTGKWAVGDFYKCPGDWTALACHGVVGGVNERESMFISFYHKSYITGDLCARVRDRNWEPAPGAMP